MTELDLFKSRFPWLGSIPAHWRNERLRWFIRDLTQGWSPEAEDREPTENEWGVLKLNSVQRGKFNAAAVKTVPPELEVTDSLQLRPGDVLVTRANTPSQVGDACFVIKVRPRIIPSDLIYRVRLHEDRIDGRFLTYVLLSPIGRRQIESDARGSSNSMVKVSQEHIVDWWIPVPPIFQQHAISDYLDCETAQLDALVTAKERVLRLLAEKRRALITRAVTRGLDPRAPLRDSGIPWLGEIPAHWETERARWLFRERDQRSEAGEEELLTVSHLTGVTPRSEKDVNMFEAETTEGYKICFLGDLVINTLWAWMGAMGVSPVKGIVSPAYNVYQPRARLEPTYVDAMVRLPLFAQEVTRYSKGVWSSRLRLYPEGFFEVYFPVPPLYEQRKIVSHVAREVRKLDALRVSTERTITLIKERRAALITAAVTGQIDVGASA